MYNGEHAEKTTATKIRALASWAAVILAGVLIACLFRVFVGTAYAIPSGSMENTLHIGDRIFSEKVSLELGDAPSQGDIVTFTDPEIPSRTLIKRVIATGGQTIDLRDGRVYVDDQLLDEPYTEGKPTVPLTTAYGTDITYPFTVPDDTLWVMGDNRTNSADSRYFGPVPLSSVTGKAIFRSWPLQAFGPLD